jgi:hypothetical protein
VMASIIIAVIVAVAVGEVLFLIGASGSLRGVLAIPKSTVHLPVAGRSSRYLWEIRSIRSTVDDTPAPCARGTRASSPRPIRGAFRFAMGPRNQAMQWTFELMARTSCWPASGNDVRVMVRFVDDRYKRRALIRAAKVRPIA